MLKSMTRFQPRDSIPTRQRSYRLLIRLAIAVLGLILLAIFLWIPLPLRSPFSLDISQNSDNWQLETVRYYDLGNVQGTARGWEREERILLCVPLRDAEPHL